MRESIRKLIKEFAEGVSYSFQQGMTYKINAEIMPQYPCIWMHPAKLSGWDHNGKRYQVRIFMLDNGSNITEDQRSKKWDEMEALFIDWFEQRSAKEPAYIADKPNIELIDLPLTNAIEVGLMIDFTVVVYDCV